MAYEILYGTSLLYQAGNEQRKVISAKLEEHASGPSKLTVVLPPTHPLVGNMELHDFSHKVFVNWDGTQVFAGIITDSETDIDGAVTITVDDVLTLLDMPLVKLEDNGYTKAAYEPSDLLTAILASYNAYGLQTFASISIASTTYGAIGYLGEDDSTYYVDCDPTEVMTPWNMLKKWLIDPYKAVVHASVNAQDGYEVSIAGGAFGQHSTPIVRGVNMVGIRHSKSTDGMVTGLYVTGAKHLVAKSFPVAYNNLLHDGVIPFGATEIEVRGNTSNYDYTINDGDKLRIGSNSEGIYQAYLPLSKTLRIQGNTNTYTLPLSMPVNHEYKPSGSSTTVRIDIASSSAVFAEERGDMHDYSGRSWVIDGTRYYVTDNTVSVTTKRQRYGPKFEHYSTDMWFADWALMHAAAGELAKLLELSEAYDVEAISPALYQTGGELYRVGYLVPVSASELGVSATMLIASATTDILDLGATKYEIGYSRKTATRTISDLRLDVEHVSHRVAEAR